MDIFRNGKIIVIRRSVNLFACLDLVNFYEDIFGTVRSTAAGIFDGFGNAIHHEDAKIVQSDLGLDCHADADAGGKLFRQDHRKL